MMYDDNWTQEDDVAVNGHPAAAAIARTGWVSSDEGWSDEDAFWSR
jgi:hypothetical protein